MFVLLCEEVASNCFEILFTACLYVFEHTQVPNKGNASLA